MRRGEVRVIGSRVTGREHYALIVGNDVLTELGGWVITAPIDTSGAEPGLIVTVGIVDPVKGAVRLDSVTSVRKDRVGDLVGVVGPDVMEAVGVALRAALDL